MHVRGRAFVYECGGALLLLHVCHMHVQGRAVTYACVRARCNICMCDFLVQHQLLLE